MLVFRTAEPSETGVLRTMWEEAFGDEQPWTDWFFASHHRVKNVWVGVNAGVLVAQAHLLPYVLHVRGKSLPVCYFVGVCVSESLRGKGFGKKLMHSAMQELKRQGFAAGILQPRFPAFYQALGWEYFYRRRVHRLALPQQTPLTEKTDRTKPEQATIGPDIPSMAAIYDAFTRNLHAYAIRDRLHWEQMLAGHAGDEGRVVILRNGETPKAYAMYHLRFGSLTAEEIGYVDSAGQAAVLEYLMTEAQHAGAEWMEWTDPADAPDDFSQLSTQRLEPILMVRLSDPMTALQRAVAPGGSGRILLEVTDAANKGPLSHTEITFQNVAIYQTPAASKDNADVCLDTSALAQLLFGYYSVADLMAQRRMLVTDVLAGALLSRVFPVQQNYLGDYF